MKLLINRVQILEKAVALGNDIAKEEEIQIFKKAEQKIAVNKNVQTLIQQIKLKQQELVNAKHIKKPNYINQIENELDSLNKELYSIPLVHQFQQFQSETNKYLQTIIQVLEGQLSNNIPIEREKTHKMELPFNL